MKRVVAAIVLLAGLACLPAAASSQTPPQVSCGTSAICAVYQDQLNSLLSEMTRDPAGQRARDALRSLAAIESNEELLVIALAREAAFDNFVQAWEQARVDKQAGTTATSAGTTALVAKPSTSELIALAMQMGALTQTVNGTTATLQMNADGAFRALSGAPVSCLACSATPVLRDINFMATFDLSRPGDETVATSGAATPGTPAPPTVLLPTSTRQLSAFTARYNLYNPVDVRSDQFKKGWTRALADHSAEMKQAARAVLDAFRPVFEPLIRDPAYLARQQEYAARFREDAARGNASALANDFTAYVNQLVALARTETPDLNQAIVVAAQALTRLTQLNYETVQQAKGKPQVTLEYTFSRPVSQPETHALRFILGLRPFDGNGLVSVNAASTFYGGAIPAGSTYGRMRDFQLAAQFDRPIGDPITHPATLSIAGYVQYQFDPSVLDIGPGNLAPGTNITLPQDAKVLLGGKGTLAVAQAKLTINGKSGINIPIAVSWANRTDLLKAGDVRGQFGISYDFSSMAQLFGGR